MKKLLFTVLAVMLLCVCCANEVNTFSNGLLDGTWVYSITYEDGGYSNETLTFEGNFCRRTVDYKYYNDDGTTNEQHYWNRWKFEYNEDYTAFTLLNGWDEPYRYSIFNERELWIYQEDYVLYKCFRKLK